jgi:hypothetical protein
MEGLHLTEKGKDKLNKARKWTKFLAILGFISTGGGFLSAALLVATAGSDGVMIGLPIFASLITTLLPAIFLNNFSNQSRDAVRNDDSNMLELSLGNLNATFKTYGILAIIGIAGSLIAIVAVLASGI